MTERGWTRMRRREFIATLGGGVLVLVNAPSLTVEDAWAQGRRGYPTDINAYLHIAPDGKITLFSGKIEMGQGVVTSLTQMAAEELRVALERITIVMGDTATCPWDAGTWGSLSTRVFGPAVRTAAAQARLILTDLAAQRLGVPRSALTADNGTVFVTANRTRRVSYGQLAQGRRITHVMDEQAVLRSVREFTVMGQSPKRLDGRDKVTGAATYAGDIRRPGMLYARLLRPPAHGATLRSVDTSAAEALRVTVVNQDGLVAVLADDPETAFRALEAVRPQWDVPAPAVNTESIFDHLVRVGGEGQQRDAAGDLAAGRAASARTFDVTYTNAYVAHAPMEPHTAVAEWSGDTVTVWSATQTPFGLQAGIARALSLPPERVRVITPYVGGGFGGKSTNLEAREAIRLARITGRPVMVAWTRAEEFFYDTFRPAAVVRVNSGYDATGRLTLWDYQVYGAGSRGSEPAYDVPNRRVRIYGEWGDTSSGPSGMHPFAVGPWRAPAANTNRFAIEQQLDLMAAAAGVDPIEFRLRNTRDERMRRVLETVARASGWSSAVHPRRSGRGLGVACGVDAGAYVATVAEVAVDRATGAVKVERVVCAQDMGLVVNPDGARMQMEGCITMGLGYALAEEVRFEGGAIRDLNFDTYQLPRFSWLPAIETVIVPNDDLAPQGGGEPAIVTMGAVIANAIYDATGARLTHLPMTPGYVLAAMRQA